MLKNGVLLITQHYPGYGDPESWTIKAVFDNRVLAEKSLYSEYDLGVASTELKSKWGKLSKKELESRVKGKKLASSWCSICGGDTLNGGTSCCDLVFCKNDSCQNQIKFYQDWSAAKSEDWRRKDLKQARAENQKQVESCLSGFHWKDNKYFRRSGDVVEMWELHRASDSNYENIRERGDTAFATLQIPVEEFVVWQQ